MKRRTTDEARQALDLLPGSVVAYALVQGAIVIIPEDPHLAEVGVRAERILAAAGLAAPDLIGELPAVRDEILRVEYGDAVLEELQRRLEAAQGHA